MFTKSPDNIGVASNFRLVLRERGKIVRGSERVGHNIFTDVGRGWLTRLVAWNTIGSPDMPFTQQRVRWMGMGTGSLEEVPSIISLANAAKYDSVDYLAPIDSVEFPDASTVRIVKLFGPEALNPDGGSIRLTEAGLYVDVNPADENVVDDLSVLPGTYETVLNPALASNPPIAYKSFEPITKTQDFSLEIQWELRF